MDSISNDNPFESKQASLTSELYLTDSPSKPNKIETVVRKKSGSIVLPKYTKPESKFLLASETKNLKLQANPSVASKNSISGNSEQKSEGDRSSLIGSFVGPNSSLITTPTNTKIEKKLFQGAEPRQFAKSVATAIDLKAKKKRKLIRHCKDDPVPEPEEEEEIPSEKEEWLYKFNSDNEFYKAFVKKFSLDFKFANQKNSFTLTSKRDLSLEERRKIAEGYIADLNELELADLNKRLQSKINEIEERKYVSQPIYNINNK